MKTPYPNNLGRALVQFFQEYLPAQRGMSPHTIRSYRDAIVLFLRFAAQDAGRPAEALEIDDLCADRVTRFLAQLEQQRGNRIATRNARLAAMHTLARYLALDHPQHMATLQALLAVPFKRGARDAPIEYLEYEEVRELLAVIDRSHELGQRDYALFALMFNTGARVQEILDLTAADVRLDAPAQVRLTGKGNKVRVCPIWSSTAQLLRPLCMPCDGAGQGRPLFVNHRGEPLTRFGVRYLLQRYMAQAAQRCPTLRGKSIHPHSLRHTTAVHLLKAGVDFASISQWLGHASLNTTMIYARADLDLKRQALLQVFPDALAAPRAGRTGLPPRIGLVDWLRRL
ncbi:tyrosine-type recombinase/integrase [Azohydromonas aeria]|uniref:tyrosine-type recombinase/integrase n=1 Tax=Azohydromonas aeria TaxID=2590212 RepID=UPI0012F76880|nr:tyrosine-type recombinase/integrase [Azohydromonas aeria]